MRDRKLHSRNPVSIKQLTPIGMSLAALAGRKAQQDSEPGLCAEWGPHVQGSKYRNLDAHSDLSGNNIMFTIHEHK